LTVVYPSIYIGYSIFSVCVLFKTGHPASLHYNKDVVGEYSYIIQGDQKVSVHLTITVQYSWWSEDGPPRIHSEYKPWYTKHGLREHNSACQ